MSLHSAVFMLLLLGPLSALCGCSHLPVPSSAAAQARMQSNIKTALHKLKTGDVITVKTSQSYYHQVKVVAVTENSLETDIASLPLSSIQFIEKIPSAKDKTVTLMHSGVLLTLGVFLLSAIGAGILF